MLGHPCCSSRQPSNSFPATAQRRNHRAQELVLAVRRAEATWLRQAPLTTTASWPKRRRAAGCGRCEKSRGSAPAPGSAMGDASEVESEEEVTVGIDLGTTNSVVAVMGEGGQPVCIPVEEDGLGTTTILPSVVAFPGEDLEEVLVGTKAKRQAVLNPESTYFSVKRLIGRAIEEVSPTNWPFKVVADGDGAVQLKNKAAPEGVLYPEEISACIVARLLEAAAAYTGAEIRKAVISVPAYFSEGQKEATMAAGHIAGLEEVRLIKEPVAAALAYGLDVERDQTVMVFDLGGGTFDISLLEVGGGVIEVLSTGGDAELGGDDWDRVIMSWLERKHLQPAGVDCSDARIQTNLRAMAEAAKIKLSSSEQVTLRMPVGGGIEAVLTRGMLDSMSKELYRGCRVPLDKACWSAGVDLETVVSATHDQGAKRRKQAAGEGGIRPKRRPPVSAILLVGGSTRMPSVKQFIRNMTGIEPCDTEVDPDKAVALGAAIHAASLSGRVPDLMLMDPWQAELMRAFAKARLSDDEELAKQMLGPDYYDDDDDDGEAEESELGEDADDVLDGGEQRSVDAQPTSDPAHVRRLMSDQ